MATQELTQGPAPNSIKVFEPAMKDPNDQLVYALEQIEAIHGVPTAPASAGTYADAFSPTGSLWSVNTGNASVRQVEDLKDMMSTPPEIDRSPIDWVSIAAIIAAVVVFLNLKRRK